MCHPVFKSQKSWHILLILSIHQRVHRTWIPSGLQVTSSCSWPPCSLARRSTSCSFRGSFGSRAVKADRRHKGWKILENMSTKSDTVETVYKIYNSLRGYLPYIQPYCINNTKQHFIYPSHVYPESGFTLKSGLYCIWCNIRCYVVVVWGIGGLIYKFISCSSWQEITKGSF